MQQLLSLSHHAEVDRIAVCRVDSTVNKMEALFIELPGLLETQEQEIENQHRWANDYED